MNVKFKTGKKSYMPEDIKSGVFYATDALYADFNSKRHKYIDEDDVNSLINKKTDADSLNYTTEVPTSINFDGIKVCFLLDEPETKYDGWLYLIAEEE